MAWGAATGSDEVAEFPYDTGAAEAVVSESEVGEGETEFDCYYETAKP